jgi:Rv0078B-related antitoxin
MNPHQPLIDQLYREEILRARKQTPQDRLRATFEVTEFALRMMRGSLRHHHPEADDAEILRLGRERIAKVRRLNEWKLYRPAERPT